MTKVLLISDTHSYLDPKLIKHINSVDEVWHAGDVGKIELLDQLKKLKPVRGVYGNIDDHIVRMELPLFNNFVIEGVKFLMTHIGGKPGKHSSTVRNEIEKTKPNVFICGHSHILRVEYDNKTSCLHLNPGACGNHGFHSIKTVLKFDIRDGKISNLNVIELGSRI